MDRVRLVSTFDTVTLVLGNTEPELSRTVPSSVAVTSAWSEDGKTEKKRASEQRAQKFGS